MKPFSHVVEAMPKSGIREMMELAAQLEGVIHLEVGDPDFITPAHIIEAGLAGAREGYTKYTSSAGLPSLRRAIAERISDVWGRPVGPERVLVTTGAVGALTGMIFALAEEGDEVLLPDPGWPNYAAAVALSRAQPTFYPLRPEEGYVPDVDRVATRITPRTKLMLINNPSNPTGAVFPRETVEALVRLARERDIYLLTDEVYEEMVFDGDQTPAGRYDDDLVVTVSGCSKTYAMTGWRLGYAIAHPDLISLAALLQEPLVSCPCSVSQRAAEAALRGPQECVGEMRAAYRRRRNLVYEMLGPVGLLPVAPKGAFYALIDLRRLGMSSRDLARGILREERVATAPGDTFGRESEGMVRISLATADDDLVEGCRRIMAFAARHTPGDSGF